MRLGSLIIHFFFSNENGMLLQLQWNGERVDLMLASTQLAMNKRPTEALENTSKSDGAIVAFDYC